MHQISIPLFDEGMMDLLTVPSRTISPTGHGPLIQPLGVNNRLDGTSIGQQRYHNHNQFAWLTKPFHHGSPSSAKGVSTRATPIALPLAIMNLNIALPSLASCRTRPIRAKLQGRVHRLCRVCLHTHSLPMIAAFFKPSFLLFTS